MLKRRESQWAIRISTGEFHSGQFSGSLVLRLGISSTEQIVEVYIQRHSMQHFVEAPFVGGPVQDAEAAGIAMGYTYFHWGISQWSIFGVAGLAIGYFQYRKNRDGLVSTSLEPLFGFNYNQKSRNAIDI